MSPEGERANRSELWKEGGEGVEELNLLCFREGELFRSIVSEPEAKGVVGAEGEDPVVAASGGKAGSDERRGLLLEDGPGGLFAKHGSGCCLLYTSDAADE